MLQVSTAKETEASTEVVVVVMFNRSHQFTTITSLPSSITRQSVLEILHPIDLNPMIDLNPIVAERHPIPKPRSASSDELPFHWYRIRDGMQGGYAKYDAGFRNFDDGVQTRVYAPLGLKVDGKWTLCEELEKVGDDVTKPEKGLWIREDVDMECNVFLTWFVKWTMKKAHAELVQRLTARASQKLIG